MAIWNRQPKRQVPSPEPLVRHTSNNPMFQSTTPTVNSAVRGQVLRWMLYIIGLAVIGVAIYGPWFRVTTVTIAGTHAINPKSLQSVTTSTLHQHRWLVIPNDNLWLLSSHWLSDHLQQIIRQRISVEEVLVTKHYPHHLTVTVHERIPAWEWQSGSQVATVDRHGVIMQLSANEKNLPVVVDEALPLMTVDTSVVKEEVVQAMTALDQAMHAAQLNVDHYIIPAPSCPTTASPKPTEPVNTNTANVNVSLNVNVSVNENANVGETTNLNTNTGLPCDLAALHRSSAEIHLQLKNGPQVYFDRHQSITKAVQTLSQVLAHPDGTIHSYIDLRFGDRVFVK